MATNPKYLNFYNLVDRIDKRWLFALLLCLELSIYFLDYITDINFRFTAIYLIPICAGALFLGTKSTYFIALVALIAIIVDSQDFSSHFDLALFVFDYFSKAFIFFTFAFIILQFRHLLEDFKNLSNIDELTEANTRRSFYEISKREIARSFRYKQPLTLAYIDLDNFKEVNDTSGHKKGDQLLVKTASTIQSSLRNGDILGRLGGDEFVILLHRTNQDEAKVIMERIRENLLNAISIYKTNVTYSIGVVTYLGDKPSKIDELVAFADKSMYSIKASTKNSIQFVTV